MGEEAHWRGHGVVTWRWGYPRARMPVRQWPGRHSSNLVCCWVQTASVGVGGCERGMGLTGASVVVGGVVTWHLSRFLWGSSGAAGILCCWHLALLTLLASGVAVTHSASVKGEW